MLLTAQSYGHTMLHASAAQKATQGCRYTAENVPTGHFPVVYKGTYRVHYLGKTRAGRRINGVETGVWGAKSCLVLEQAGWLSQWVYSNLSHLWRWFRSEQMGVATGRYQFPHRLRLGSSLTVGIHAPMPGGTW